MKAGYFAVLGLAALAAAFVIGLSNPTLIDGGQYSDVTCGQGWGGSPSNATESGESACAPIRSERFVWSITLLGLGVGLLSCGLMASRADSRARVVSAPSRAAPPPAAAPPIPAQQFAPPAPRNDSEREIIEAAQAGISVASIASIRGIPEAEVARVLGLQ